MLIYKKKLTLFVSLLILIFASCKVSTGNKRSDSLPLLSNQSDNIQGAILSKVPAAKIDSAKKEVALEFSARHGYGWNVSWAKDIMTPIAVYGGTTKPVKSNPAKAARAFLAQNRRLFNMHKGLKDLKLLEVRKMARGMLNVRFQQTYHELPIFGAGYDVHIRSDGRIDMANGHYYHHIEISDSAEISASAAKQAVFNDLDRQNGQAEKLQAVPGIYRKPKDGNFTLVWRIIVPANGPVSRKWLYFINAYSGKIITKINLNPPYFGKDNNNGEGNIIKNRPKLAPNPVKITLHHLDKSGYLRGLYADVYNMSHKRAYSSIHDFKYNKSSTHFDEVNVYYHLDNFRTNFENKIGFAGKKLGRSYAITAYVHDKNKSNNAKFIPPDTLLIGENMGEKAEVIEHEATHALIHKIDPNPIYSNHKEEGAINEGLADFFPGAYENDPDLPGTGRDLDHPFYSNYSDIPRQKGHIYIPDSHEGGNFFASILWAIHVNKYGYGKISHHALNRDVYCAVKKLSATPTFIEFRDAMMTADGEHYGGHHKNLIQDTFAKKGVGHFTPLNVSINGPSKLEAGKIGTWRADVSNGKGPYHYTWYRQEQSFDGSTLYYKVGTRDSYTGSASGTTDFHLRLDVTNGNKSGSTIFYVDAGGMDHPFPSCNDDDISHVCIGNN